MEAETRPDTRRPRLDDGWALHARLLARDPAAPSDLAVAYLEPLVRWLCTQFPRVEEHRLEEVAIDLILSLAERPEQYDPERTSLTNYLHMAGRRDVLNALRSERRRTRLLAPIDDVELVERAGNILMESAGDPADLVVEGQRIDRDTLAMIRSSFDDTEWEVVQLMLEGERRTSVYARVLGLADRPDITQAREVKRVKDRLLKRLQRLAPRVRRDD